MDADYLQPGMTCAAPQLPVIMVDNDSGTGVNLRKLPQSDSEIIQTAQNGETVTVLSVRADGWYQVIYAQEIGFDFAGTTLRGYTEYTEGIAIPDYDLLKKMAEELKIPVIAEGGIWSPEQLRAAIDCGVHAAVVGTAITRPMDITKRYVKALD